MEKVIEKVVKGLFWVWGYNNPHYTLIYLQSITFIY